MTPTILETPTGWLAVSPLEYRLRIGVQGGTQAQAVANFDAAVAAWERLAKDEADANL